MECHGREALINLQKLLKTIKEYHTKSVLQRFPKILKWGSSPLRGAFRLPFADGTFVLKDGYKVLLHEGSHDPVLDR